MKPMHKFESFTSLKLREAREVHTYPDEGGEEIREKDNKLIITI